MNSIFQEYHQSLQQLGSRSGPTNVGLIWVQIAYKGYRQMKLAENELNQKIMIILNLRMNNLVD